MNVPSCFFKVAEADPSVCKSSTLINKPKFAFAANLQGYLIKDKKKIEEKIYYDFKDIPMIDNKKLIKLQEEPSNNDIFFRTYSYGLWYNTMFK